jgi:hypothetical protein
MFNTPCLCFSGHSFSHGIQSWFLITAGIWIYRLSLYSPFRPTSHARNHEHARLSLTRPSPCGRGAVSRRLTAQPSPGPARLHLLRPRRAGSSPPSAGRRGTAGRMLLSRGVPAAHRGRGPRRRRLQAEPAGCVPRAVGNLSRRRVIGAAVDARDGLVICTCLGLPCRVPGRGPSPRGDRALGKAAFSFVTLTVRSPTEDKTGAASLGRRG